MVEQQIIFHYGQVQRRKVPVQLVKMLVILVLMLLRQVFKHDYMFPVVVFNWTTIRDYVYLIIPVPQNP